MDLRMIHSYNDIVIDTEGERKEKKRREKRRGHLKLMELDQLYYIPKSTPMYSHIYLY